MPYVKRSRRSALDGSLIAFVDHAELHDRRRREALIQTARELLAHPTLGTEDELSLFKALQACGYLLSRRCALRFATRSVLRRVADLHRRLRDRLVEENIGLVYEMRRRTRIVDVDADEVTSEAFWALFQAVTRFDPWRGFRFSTYACTSMLHGALLLAKKHRRQREQLRRLQQTFEESDDSATEIDALDREVLIERLRSVLTNNRAGLTPAERFIVERRLLQQGATRGETLESVGGFFNLSKERIRQIQISAMGKLRSALRDREEDEPLAAPVTSAEAGRDRAVRARRTSGEPLLASCAGGLAA